jgi:hypothetical protein
LQGLVKSCHLPVVVGVERGKPGGDAVSRQIRSKSTSPGRGLVNRPVNCFPLSVNTSLGTPKRCNAARNAVHTARPVARRTTLATQYREWSSTPVTHLRRRTVGEQDRLHDVHLPQVDRLRTFPPNVVFAPPTSTYRADQVVAHQNPVNGR